VRLDVKQADYFLAAVDCEPVIGERKRAAFPGITAAAISTSRR
jgi:hypothetical protein